MQINWPSTTWPGDIPQEGMGRLINAMAEKMGDEIKWIRSPGVQRYYTSPESGFRGMGFVGNQLFVSYKDHLYVTTLSNSSPLTKVPDASPTTVSGVGPVFFAANQKQPIPDVVAVAPQDGNIPFLITQTSQHNYPDTDVNSQGAVVDVCFGLGFFFFATASGQCLASALNDTAVNPLDFTTASSKPDGLLRCIFFQGALYLCGPDSIEVWGQPINPVAFPLNLITAIPRGIVGNRAITGFENGIDLGLAFVSGNSQVMILNGYQPQRISQPDLERLIFNTADKSTIEMTSFVSDAHIFLKVKAPNYCWLYDFTTQTWHERASYLSATSRMKQAVYAAWPNNPIWLIGDEGSGDVGRVLGSVFDEWGSPLIWSITSKPVEPFPYRAVVGPAYFNFVPGQGSNVPYQVNIAGVTAANPCVVTTAGVHALQAGMGISIQGLLGTMSGLNSVAWMVAAPVTPTSFVLADSNNNIVDSTPLGTYSGGGVITRLAIPTQQVLPQVEIKWSDDGGLTYRNSEIRPLGPQGASRIKVRVFLTGSMGVQGRTWNLRISDPVYISFRGGEMPRIAKREAA